MKPAKKKGPLRRVFILIGRALLALIVLYAATFAWYRLRGPTEEQQAALALMRKDYRPAHGVNAFPLLFYLSYDVPAERLDAQMAVDVEKVRKQIDAYKAGETNITENADTDAPPLPSLSQAENAALCRKDCLAKVSAQPDAVRAALAAHPVEVARAQAFERADFNWNEFPANMFSPIGYMGFINGQRFWLSAFALKYAEGDRTGALAATCRNLAAWRRMASASNTQIGALMSDARMNDAIRLYADMLVGLPADAVVPEDCALALRPVAAADVDRCAQLAGTLAEQEAMFRWVGGRTPQARWYERLVGTEGIDVRQTTALTAQTLAASCGSDAIARFLADELPRKAQVRFPSGLECIANRAGCFIAPMMASTYATYDEATLDRAAHLRLAATLLWLREQPEGSIAERFARRPAELRSPNHDSGFDAQRGALYVKNLRQASPPREDRLRLELPIATPH